MIKCEDYPCCGHKLGECPLDEDEKRCPSCGLWFQPTGLNEKYCLSCGSMPVFSSAEDRDDWWAEQDYL